MSGRSVRRVVVAVIGAGALTGAVGLGSLALAAGHDVEIAGFAFSPETINVKVGETVTWTNNDGATHTATADGGSFDTGNLGTGASETVTFSSAGTFEYHCGIHRAMSGTVTVSAAGVTAPNTDTEAPPAPATDRTPVVAAWLGLAAIAGLALGRRRFARAA